MKKFKDSTIIFFAQFISYAIICISMRAVNNSNYLMIAITDIVFTSLNFFVIKKIADKDDKSKSSFFAYTMGSVTGSLFGTWFSGIINN